MTIRDVGVVLLAAGRSSRMGPGKSKVYRRLGAKPVLRFTLDTLREWPRLAALVVVHRREDGDAVESLLAGFDHEHAVVASVEGGVRRQDSVWRGLGRLQQMSPPVPIVLVHDGARPLATRSLFQRVADAAMEHGAAVPGVPVMDTLRRISAGNVATVSRENLYAVQTPQGFRRKLLVDAHRRHRKEDVTDDGMLLEAVGRPVAIISGELQNRKITVPADLEALEQWLLNGESRMNAARIGLGHDLHRLVKGGPLKLAGVEIPAEVHAEGHSDADVVLHAVADAVLGSVAAGDIGEHFSDQNAANAGVDSARIVGFALEQAARRGFLPIHVDVTISLEQPKLAPHRRQMRQQLAELLGLDLSQVSLKATTNEGMDAIGEGKAIACTALVQCTSDKGITLP